MSGKESTLQLEGGVDDDVYRKNKKKNTILYIIIGVLVVAVIGLGAAFGITSSGGGDSSSEDAAASAPAPSEGGSLAPIEPMIREFNLQGHMQRLMEIAKENGGTRDLPDGERLTADYIVHALTPYIGSYYTVQTQYFGIPYKKRNSNPEFTIDGEKLPFIVKDAPEAVFCDVTRVSDLKFEAEEEPLHLLNNGCEDAHWDGHDVTGRIVIVDQTGYSEIKKSPVCSITKLRETAQGKGAKALIVAFADETGFNIVDETDYGGKMGYIHPCINRGSTGYNPVPDPEAGVEPFPIFYVRQPYAHKLREAKTVGMKINHEVDWWKVRNIIVDTIGGEPQTISINAHTDGVTAGAGANDDGSGTVVALTIALAFAERGVQPTNKIRFIFAGAEELSVAGSFHYLKDMHKGDLVANVNMDMVGSINGRISICNGSTHDPMAFAGFGPKPQPWLKPEDTEAIKAASVKLDTIFHEYMTARNIPHDIKQKSKGSDQNNYQSLGVPATCVESGGGSYEKLPADAAEALNGMGLWEAKADEMVDPCYHSGCDHGDTNINFKLMRVIAQVMAGVIDQLADDPNVKETIGFKQVAPFRDVEGTLPTHIQEGTLRGLMWELMNEVVPIEGHRAVGPEPGEKHTAEWIKKHLQPHVDSGFITLEEVGFDIPVKVRSSDPVLEIDGQKLPYSTGDGDPNNVYCDITRVGDMDFDMTAEPIYIGNGCDEAVWNASDIKGRIVITDQTGYSEQKKSPLCSVTGQRKHAQRMGAAMLIMAHTDENGLDIVTKTAYPERQGYFHACVNRGWTGYSPVPDAEDGMEPFPVFYVRQPYASKIKTAKSVHVSVHHKAGTMPSRSLIVETTGGDSPVVGSTAHIDGANAGPGANDDGSGTTAMLSIILALAQRGQQPLHKMRFVFVGSEEISVWGSYDYVKNHYHGDMMVLMNMDMVGSPNGAVGICNGTTHNPEAFLAFGPKPPEWSTPEMVDYVRTASAKFDQIIIDYLHRNNIPYYQRHNSKGSDQNNFQTFGIASSCVESGGGGYEDLSWERAAPILHAGWWEAKPGKMVDPCYHNVCDNIENINFHLMTKITKVVAGVLEEAANDPDFAQRIGYVSYHPHANRR